MTDDMTRWPICFVFSGTTARRDGSEVRPETPLLRDSVNYLQMLAGFDYPLYYNTLFAALRDVFNEVLVKAKRKKAGYWVSDAAEVGVTVNSRAGLTQIPPIWPKLWRRLYEFCGNAMSLSGFVAFLEKKNERIDILSVMEERGLQDLVDVKDDKVRLLEHPENLRVVGKAGRRHR